MTSLAIGNHHSTHNLQSKSFSENTLNISKLVSNIQLTWRIYCFRVCTVAQVQGLLEELGAQIQFPRQLQPINFFAESLQNSSSTWGTAKAWTMQWLTTVTHITKSFQVSNYPPFEDVAACASPVWTPHDRIWKFEGHPTVNGRFHWMTLTLKLHWCFWERPNFFWQTFAKILPKKN